MPTLFPQPASAFFQLIQDEEESHFLRRCKLSPSLVGKKQLRQALAHGECLILAVLILCISLNPFGVLFPRGQSHFPILFLLVCFSNIAPSEDQGKVPRITQTFWVQSIFSCRKISLQFFLFHMPCFKNRKLRNSRRKMFPQRFRSLILRIIIEFNSLIYTSFMHRRHLHS